MLKLSTSQLNFQKFYKSQVNNSFTALWGNSTVPKEVFLDYLHSGILEMVRGHRSPYKVAYQMTVLVHSTQDFQT